MGADFKLNMAELVAIANATNEQVCKPLAEAIASRARDLAEGISVTGAYRDSITVDGDARDGIDDWAHSRVITNSPYAMRVESRHGILGRAAGL